jgi:hypothetical protein
MSSKVGASPTPLAKLESLRKAHRWTGGQPRKRRNHQSPVEGGRRSQRSYGRTEALVAEDVRRLTKGEVYMDEMRERVEDIMRRYGFAEEEAYAHYHLEEARRRFEKLYGRGVAMSTIIFPHSFALRAFLAHRVLGRDYPEGWRRVPTSVDDEE